MFFSRSTATAAPSPRADKTCRFAHAEASSRHGAVVLRRAGIPNAIEPVRPARNMRATMRARAETRSETCAGDRAGARAPAHGHLERRRAALLRASPYRPHLVLHLGALSATLWPHLAAFRPHPFDGALTGARDPEGARHSRLPPARRAKMEAATRRDRSRIDHGSITDRSRIDHGSINPTSRWSRLAPGAAAPAAPQVARGAARGRARARERERGRACARESVWGSGSEGMGARESL